MRLCNRCKKAENPKGELSFVGSPEGVLCENCYTRFYSGFPEPADAAESDYAVITCPDCRGNSHALHGVPCPACQGLGVVRIAKSVLSVYTGASAPTKVTHES